MYSTRNTNRNRNKANKFVFFENFRREKKTLRTSRLVLFFYYFYWAD